MKGTFKITLDYLRELGACRDGQREFQKAFPDGGEYQEVLDRCAEEGRLDFGCWLLGHIGPTEDTRTYKEPLDTPEHGIIFAGQIEFKTFAAIKFVVSGEGIEAGEGIKAGADFGIYAGLRTKISLWNKFSVVSAKNKPENLISGYWAEKGKDA